MLPDARAHDAYSTDISPGPTHNMLLLGSLLLLSVLYSSWRFVLPLPISRSGRHGTGHTILPPQLAATLLEDIAMSERNSGGRSTTSSYPSATSYKNSVNIVERVWEVPAGFTAKAGLVIVHGGTWHSGWFGELGDLLSSADYSVRVSAPDLIAHGLSDDVIPGCRSYCPDFAEHAEEVRAAVARARASLPERTPIFLLGESMGGLCALQHLIMHDTDVDGVILCGAVIQVAPALLPPQIVVSALKGISWLLPTMAVPGEDVGGDTFDRAFGDPAVAPVARADPLVADKAPQRLGYMMGALDAMDLVKRDAAKKIKVRGWAGGEDVDKLYLITYYNKGRLSSIVTVSLKVSMAC